MDILFLLIPLSVVAVLAIVALFWWSLQAGQFEDLDDAGERILRDRD
jgi:cbb3-type cytochrome oxidase maturation protein